MVLAGFHTRVATSRGGGVTLTISTHTRSLLSIKTNRRQ